MAKVIWRGDAPAVSQVTEVQITAFDVLTTYKLTINGKVVSVIGDTDEATTATNLTAALAASIIPEFAEQTYAIKSGATDTIEMTSVLAGRPFVVVSSVSGGGGTIGAVSTTTSSSGPNDVSLAQNWSGGSLPIATDDVFFENTAVDALYGLETFAAVAFGSLQVLQSYTGLIGLPEVNLTGGTSYFEYREDYFQTTCLDLQFGNHSGDGSGRIKVDSVTVAAIIQVFATGTADDNDLGSVILKNQGSGATLYARSGDVGLAMLGSETTTIDAITTDGATIRGGSGLTVEDMTVNGGGLIFLFGSTIAGASTSVTLNSGTVRIEGSSALATATVLAGTLTYWATGTITTLIIGAAGSADFGNAPSALTVTNTTIHAGATLLDPNQLVTFTNAISNPGGLLPGAFTLNLGIGRDFTPG